ncbi:MAG: VCBS repeat-containing protein [Planctomycetes bacterium]|nr:VCBS repeat-containing protein [Planctomycetota bacterium]
MEFQEIRVYSDLPIVGVSAHDLNGDGLLDLVVQEGRRILVYLFDKERGISVEPQAQVELPPGAFAYDLGAINETTGFGVSYLMSDGVYHVLYKDGAFQVESKQLVELPTFFHGESTEPPVRLPFLQDLDGDGRIDLLVPQPDALAVLSQAKDGTFRVNQRIRLTPEVHVGTGGGTLEEEVTTTVSLPNFYVADVNADKRADVLLFEGDAFEIYAQDAQGRFPPAPTTRFALEGDASRKRKQRAYSFEIPPEVLDINRDGLVDAVVTNASKGTTAIFLGKAGGRTSGTPDQVVKVEGYCYRVPGWVADLNGDGFADLVQVQAKKMGVWSALQVLMTRTIDVDLTVNLWDPKTSRFEGDPAFKKELTVPFVISVTNRTISVDFPFLITFDGDFNGDGLRDLIVKTDPQTLTLFEGRRQGVFDEKPGLRIPTMDTSAYTGATVLVRDLNGDGVSDIILLHRDIENKANAIELLFSRKR